MSRLVSVYKSSRRQEMYLFVDFTEGLARVPAPLMERFGEPVQVLTLELTPERRLARAEAPVVLAQIEAAGFYLQMPPPPVESSALLPEELRE
jgi:uncharacterized protein YcgL (UPF0745 family)